jgi:enoyl-CoA hydratase
MNALSTELRDAIEAAFDDLANDIKSCPDEMIRKYKALIDDGFQMTYADGFELERKMNSAHFQILEAETIAERRRGVMERGRDQQKIESKNERSTSNN